MDDIVTVPLTVSPGAPACLQAAGAVASTAGADCASQAFFVRHVWGMGGQPRKNRRVHHIPGQVRRETRAPPLERALRDEF